MTLFKQVAILVSLVFLMVVIVITAANIKRYGTIVEGQLQTTAQDMATTLGITISNTASGGDIAIYETLFNAVFDSGYYSNIRLVSPDGSEIHSKSRKLEIEGVPGWFIAMIPIEPARASTQVMQGWTQLGTLELTLHPGYVYVGLYRNFVTTITWFVVIFVIGMLVLWLLLHKILSPLAAIRHQADAIVSNQFIKLESKPRTVELRTVVDAMNRMVDKVHAVFDDLEQTLVRYQKLMYEDDLTGLGNRQYFLNQLERVHSEELSGHYYMAVIKIQEIDYIRDHAGYEIADAIITSLADLLRDEATNKEEHICARLASDEFAMLIPVRDQSVNDYIESLFETFKQAEPVVKHQDRVSLNAGITTINAGQASGVVLSDSDFALIQAVGSGPYTIRESTTTDIILPHGKMQWRAWLERCIVEHKFYLVRQRVQDLTGNDVHQEVFIRLKNDDGQTVPAGMFIPMANMLDMGEAIDRVVFQLMKELSAKQGDTPVALNLTPSVFSHADALIEFNQLVRYFQETSTTLCVEASHNILEHYQSMCIEVADSVRQAGHKFGIDNLNLGHSLHDLKSVRPDYVKVNARTIYEMATGDSLAAYDALRSLTRTMDILLIAVGVDSNELYEQLRDLGVDAMQGNLLGEPEVFI